MSKIQKLFHLLQSGHERTSVEIQEYIITVCIGSRIADLRKRGCDITCRFIRKTKKGTMIYAYTMLSYPAELYKEAA